MKNKKIQLNIDLKKLTKESKKSNWQKGVYLSLGLVLILLFLGCVYLLFRPVPPSIKEIIDEEISSTDIYFKESTLEEVRERQNPTQVPESTTGKNPFTPF